MSAVANDAVDPLQEAVVVLVAAMQDEVLERVEAARETIDVLIVRVGSEIEALTDAAPPRTHQPLVWSPGRTLATESERWVMTLEHGVTRLQAMCTWQADLAARGRRKVSALQDRLKALPEGSDAHEALRKVVCLVQDLVVEAERNGPALEALRAALHGGQDSLSASARALVADMVGLDAEIQRVVREVEEQVVALRGHTGDAMAQLQRLGGLRASLDTLEGAMVEVSRRLVSQGNVPLPRRVVERLLRTGSRLRQQPLGRPEVGQILWFDT